MAIRKISELEYVNCADRSNEESVNKLKASRLELSFAERADEPFQFQSKQARYSDLLSAFKYEIVGGTDVPDGYNIVSTDFHTNVNFNGNITVNDGLLVTNNNDNILELNGSVLSTNLTECELTSNSIGITTESLYLNVNVDGDLTSNTLNIGSTGIQCNMPLTA